MLDEALMGSIGRPIVYQHPLDRPGGELAVGVNGPAVLPCERGEAIGECLHTVLFVSQRDDDAEAGRWAPGRRAERVGRLRRRGQFGVGWGGAFTLERKP